MEFEYIIGGDTHKINCEITGDSCEAEIDGVKLHFDYRLLSANCLSLIGQTGSLTVYFVRHNDEIHLFINGEKYILKDSSGSSSFTSGAGSIAAEKGLIITPMPGTIIKILVEEGDIVDVDQGLVIVEAMKMENEIRSTIKAKVKKINFKSGDSVDVGQSIIDLEELESTENE